MKKKLLVTEQHIFNHTVIHPKEADMEWQTVYQIWVNIVCQDLSVGIFRTIMVCAETLATSEGSGEPAHPHSLATAFAVHTHEVWKQMKSHTSSSIGWMHMHVEE